MATPEGSTPSANLPANLTPDREGAPQSDLAIILPISVHQKKFLKIFSNPFSPEQLQVAEELARELGIFYTSGQGDVSEDLGWIGGAKGAMQFILRRNSLDRPLILKGFNLRFPPDVQTLYKATAQYSTGVISGPLVLIDAEKLRKPIPALKMLELDGPNEDWAQWL